MLNLNIAELTRLIEYIPEATARDIHEKVKAELDFQVGEWVDDLRSKSAASRIGRLEKKNA